MREFLKCLRHNRFLIEYKLLVDLDEIEAISSDWDQLLGRSRCNRAFSSAAWYLATCRAQPSVIPCVAIACRDGAIAGVLPLALTPSTGEAAFPSAISNYNDLVADPLDDDVLGGLLDYAISNPKPYVRVDLWWVRQSSNLLRAARLLHPRLDAIRCFNLVRDYSVIRLPPSYEDYLNSRSKLFRRNVRRARRIACAAGFSVECLDPRSFPAERIPELFLSLHTARFGPKSAFLLKAEYHAFAQIALPLLFVRRQMFVLALYRGAEIVGVDLCMAGHNSLCAWNGGYPPEMEPWSPGRLLVDEGIRLAFRWGLEEYDLLRGTQEWKLSWINEIRKVGRIEIVV